MKQIKRMSKRRQLKTQKFSDGFQNIPLRMGLGTGTTLNANRYIPEFKTFNRAELEWAYQGSWMCGLAVDVVAEDMTREGVDVKCDDPDVSSGIDVALDEYRVWDSLCDAIKWARLYGGSIAVLLIDGDDMSQPLAHIPRGAFKGLLVLDCWQVNPSEELVQDLGPDFGKPMYYEVFAKQCAIDIPGNKIHHSRCIRFEGRRLPYYLRQACRGWGASILEPLFDRIEKFDMATDGAAQLVNKCYLRFYKVKGLRSILTNDVARRGFEVQMENVRQFQSIEGMTLGDVDDDFQTTSYTFTGLPEILLQFAQQISGATGIPLVRLFGQSPVGFNSTGESDIRLYYDNTKQAQEKMLRPGMKKILNAIYMSITGQAPDRDFNFDFRPLWQMTNEQKAQSATAMVGAIVQALQNEAIPLPTAMKELKKLSPVLGMFSSITDEDIAEAEKQENELMPPMAGEEINGAEQIQGSDQNANSGAMVSKETERGSQTNWPNR